MAVAPLLVGKTVRWYESEGCFDRIDEAVTVAKATFAPLDFEPVGLFYTDPEGSLPSSIEFSTPKRADLPWLLRRWMGGGETIWMPGVWQLSAGNGMFRITATGTKPSWFGWEWHATTNSRRRNHEH